MLVMLVMLVMPFPDFRFAFERNPEMLIVDRYQDLPRLPAMNLCSHAPGSTSKQQAIENTQAPLLERAVEARGIVPALPRSTFLLFSAGFLFCQYVAYELMGWTCNGFVPVT
ncbi:hypothetical protein SAMN02927924_02681 [Sphingobium faniae]|nr:hypothetical protein SAMN02927924_02681 [Sphingobium faniae]